MVNTAAHTTPNRHNWQLESSKTERKENRFGATLIVFTIWVCAECGAKYRRRHEILSPYAGAKPNVS